MNSINKLFRTASIYLIGNVLSKIFAFLLIPLYTNYISSNDYGIYDITVSILTLVIPLVFFQIWDGIFRFIYDFEKEEDKYKIVNNGLCVCLISIVLYELLFIIVAILFNFPFKILVNIYGITIALQYIFGTAARTFKKNKLYMCTGVINTFINLSLNIILILVLKKANIGSLYFSIIMGNIIQCCIIARRLRIFKNFKKNDISKNIIKKMIRFSIPIAISTISYWLLSGYTKIIVSKNLSYSSNGVFAIATRLASIITLVVSVLQMAWHEISFESANSKDRKNFYQKGLNMFLLYLSIGTAIAIMIIKVVFPYIVNGEYITAKNIIPIVLIYTAINAFSGFSSSQFLAEKNSKIPLYTTLISAILNIFISVILINKYKLLGAASSLLICFSLNTISRMYFLHKDYKIKFNKYYILLSICLFIASSVSYYCFNNIVNMILTITLLGVIIFKNKKIIIEILERRKV